MGHLLGYARVSTTDQQPQLQLDALDRAGCYRVFTESASGAAADRRSSSRSWTSSALATPWSSGSWTGWAGPFHLVDAVTGLAERGVGFCSQQEQVDTTTPGGKLVFHVFAALARLSATWSGSGPARGRPPPGPFAAVAAGRR